MFFNLFCSSEKINIFWILICASKIFSTAGIGRAVSQNSQSVEKSPDDVLISKSSFFSMSICIISCAQDSSIDFWKIKVPSLFRNSAPFSRRYSGDTPAVLISSDAVFSERPVAATHRIPACCAVLIHSAVFSDNMLSSFRSVPSRSLAINLITVILLYLWKMKCKCMEISFY